MAITPPAFQKDAIPSLKGWHHPKTNELLKSTRHTQEQLNEFFASILHDIMHDHSSPAPLPCPDCDDEIVIDSTNDIPDDLEAMTKRELEAYARENLDVELDRRSSKKTLLRQVAELVKR